MHLSICYDTEWQCYDCRYGIFGFFFNDTATTEIYTYCHTLSLHDALPISLGLGAAGRRSMTDHMALRGVVLPRLWSVPIENHAKKGRRHEQGGPLKLYKGPQ